MQNLHFGAGNIGRGFIAELLNKSGYKITFVDINKEVVDNLKNRENYNIKILDNSVEIIEINNFDALNISEKKELITQKINEVNLITTSIGPNILPIIANDIANGLKEKVKSQNIKFLDIIACENMIEGSSFLKKEIYKNLSEDEQKFVDKYVSFPNSAVDRIVPSQKHDDVLLVEVEKFYEWVVEKEKIKDTNNKNIFGVTYVDDLTPFIERKLFTVNTGHASLSYLANYKNLTLVSEAAENSEIKEHLNKVLEETSNLLIKKWNFKDEDMKKYREKTIKRFENKLIIDNVNRICRTPIRKLGYNERFIKPIRECKENLLSYENLAKTCAYILKFKDENDTQSVQMNKILQEKEIATAITEITEIKDSEIINKIIKYYNEI